MWPLTNMFLSFVVSWVGRKFPKTPQITAEELSRQLKLDPSAPLILDCRAEDEYQVGHIKDAKHVDYRADEEAVKRILQDEVTADTTSIICYCSVGYRSSILADKINKLRGPDGCNSSIPPAFNLKGSIFQWANDGREMVDSKGKATDDVHPFNWMFGLGVSPNKWRYD